MKASRARIDGVLSALADPQRRRIVDLLSQRPRPAGELAGSVGVSAPAMSRHLRTLRETGLVEERHDGLDARVRVYSLRPEPIAELKRWLEETEALWGRQLVAPKAHVEKRKR
ncbi:MAG: metalloregulator ArsR/SmtB family transcription factor [Rhizomicrobium sp.]